MFRYFSRGHVEAVIKCEDGEAAPGGRGGAIGDEAEKQLEVSRWRSGCLVSALKISEGGGNSRWYFGGIPDVRRVKSFAAETITSTSGSTTGISSPGFSRGVVTDLLWLVTVLRLSFGTSAPTLFRVRIRRPRLTGPCGIRYYASQGGGCRRRGTRAPEFTPRPFLLLSRAFRESPHKAVPLFPVSRGPPRTNPKNRFPV